jgi:hypothetical protein
MGKSKQAMKTTQHPPGKPRPPADRVFTRFMLDLQLIQRARRKMACGEMDPGERAKVDGFEADAFQHLAAYLAAKGWTRVRVHDD